MTLPSLAYAATFLILSNPAAATSHTNDAPLQFPPPLSPAEHPVEFEPEASAALDSEAVLYGRFLPAQVQNIWDILRKERPDLERSPVFLAIKGALAQKNPRFEHLGLRENSPIWFSIGAFDKKQVSALEKHVDALSTERWYRGKVKKQLADKPEEDRPRLYMEMAPPVVFGATMVLPIANGTILLGLMPMLKDAVQLDLQNAEESATALAKFDFDTKAARTLIGKLTTGQKGLKPLRAVITDELVAVIYSSDKHLVIRFALTASRQAKPRDALSFLTRKRSTAKLGWGAKADNASVLLDDTMQNEVLGLQFNAGTAAELAARTKDAERLGRKLARMSTERRKSDGGKRKQNARKCASLFRQRPVSQDATMVLRRSGKGVQLQWALGLGHHTLDRFAGGKTTLPFEPSTVLEKATLALSVQADTASLLRRIRVPSALRDVKKVGLTLTRCPRKQASLFAFRQFIPAAAAAASFGLKRAKLKETPRSLTVAVGPAKEQAHAGTTDSVSTPAPPYPALWLVAGFSAAHKATAFLKTLQKAIENPPSPLAPVDSKAQITLQGNPYDVRSWAAEKLSVGLNIATSKKQSTLWMSAGNADLKIFETEDEDAKEEPRYNAPFWLLVDLGKLLTQLEHAETSLTHGKKSKAKDAAQKSKTVFQHVGKRLGVIMERVKGALVLSATLW